MTYDGMDRNGEYIDTSEIADDRDAMPVAYIRQRGPQHFIATTPNGEVLGHGYDLLMLVSSLRYLYGSGIKVATLSSYVPA